MDRPQTQIASKATSYSLRRSTIYAKEHLKENLSEVYSVSNADSSYSSKPRKRKLRKTKTSKREKKCIETSESEMGAEEAPGIEPNALDMILLNKLPTSQKDLRLFKLEIDKHVQKYRNSFFADVQSNKREFIRKQK